jgi:hypothetical protein
MLGCQNFNIPKNIENMGELKAKQGAFHPHDTQFLINKHINRGRFLVCPPKKVPAWFKSDSRKYPGQGSSVKPVANLGCPY